MAIQKFLVALAMVGLVDSISYMVVAPSIVFYVLDHGGTKEQYGLILSAFSFSSFLAKPCVGYCSDHFGFRVPYFITLAISALGGFIYLIADAYDGPTAVGMILASRLLSGIGASNAALGFAYMARAVPHEEQTKITSLLSMVRVLGMATGPGFNVFLAVVDMDWFGFHVNALNSVGIMLMITNIASLILIYFLLDEPEHNHAGDDEPKTDHSTWSMIWALCSLPILLPIFSILAFNANFQLIETALAPAANHALGWSPVAVSGVLGSVSIVIFVNMFIVFWLSSRKVKDEFIVMFGSCLSVIGYYLVWDLWRWESSPINFILPVLLGVSSFPFLAAPTRSLFTKAVDNIDILKDSQGSMQAVLSMFASVAGFTTPGLIAAYVLRNPEDVEKSKYHRELSAYALFAPLAMSLVLVGVIVLYAQNRGKSVDKVGDAEPSEESGLLASPKRTSATPRRFSSKCEVERRSSAAILGMVQHSMYDEHPSLYEDED